MVYFPHEIQGCEDVVTVKSIVFNRSDGNGQILTTPALSRTPLNTCRYVGGTETTFSDDICQDEFP